MELENIEYCFLPPDVLPSHHGSHFTCDEMVPALDVAVIMGLCVDETRQRIDEATSKAKEVAA